MTSPRNISRRGSTARDLAKFVAQIAVLYVILGSLILVIYLYGTR